MEFQVFNFIYTRILLIKCFYPELYTLIKNLTIHFGKVTERKSCLIVEVLACVSITKMWINACFLLFAKSCMIIDHLRINTHQFLKLSYPLLSLQLAIRNYLTGTWITISGEPDYLCEYNPSFAKANLTGSEQVRPTSSWTEQLVYYY